MSPKQYQSPKTLAQASLEQKKEEFRRNDKSTTDPWESEREFYLDLIIKSPPSIGVGVPFYVVAQIMRTGSQVAVPPPLVENGAYNSVSARVVLFDPLYMSQVRGPAYNSKPLDDASCVDKFAVDLTNGEEFRAVQLGFSDNLLSAGEYVVFKLCFEYACTRFLRFEITWRVAGKEYAAWFARDEIAITDSLPRTLQVLSPRERCIIATLVPDDFSRPLMPLGLTVAESDK
ncbi:hypothetical protein F4861DRAFT_538175 [Xylaria intraflava]|nr:hypothetical protein F4861DRAFT_538175 [Xylaria intraflava]